MMLVHALQVVALHSIRCIVLRCDGDVHNTTLSIALHTSNAEL